MNHPMADKYMRELAECTDKSTDILTAAALIATPLGRQVIKGCITYLQAALIADFTRKVMSNDWIGPKISKSGEPRPSDEVVARHLFQTVFAPLNQRPEATEYMSEIQRKYNLIKDEHRQAQSSVS